MAANLTEEEIRTELRSSAPLADQFNILRSLGSLVTFAEGGEPMRSARDLVILTLARSNEFNGYSQIVDSLAVAVGLYPYAHPSRLGVGQILEYEAHRPPGLIETVFHQVQSQVYSALMDGQSVVLSAPTSFGKSLIVDALLASGKFSNVAIVVPTIALIDETRRRLSERFKDEFKIVTHPGQDLATRNALVMTQERILDVEHLPPLDLFVIDEFYKLDPTSDPDRANLLNQAFYRLKRTGAQFYLLGPNVKQLPIELNELARVIITDFNTVSIEVHRIKSTAANRIERLVELCSQLDEPTLIYCKSPPQARQVAMALTDVRAGAKGKRLRSTIQWIGDNYHPDWSFVRALGSGVGIHHGRIPRALGQYAIRAFNSGELQFLVCTSTLIEGVNTTAKNVIVFDNKIALKRFDFFTFNNIKGRGGRMFSHFVGRVYLFHEPPYEELPTIDVPVLTQPSDTEKSLLVQIEPGDLTDESRASLMELMAQDDLPLEDIRAGAGLDPDLMVKLARRLRTEPNLHRQLAWSGLPTYEQLALVCQVIWEDLGGKRSSRSYVRSASQLAYRLRRLQQDSIRGLIEAEIEENGDPDEAVEGVLDFVRQWAGFNFPRLIMALERIANRVAEDMGRPRAAYGFYAARVEALFRPRSLVALEEYGLPIQIGDRLHEIVGLDVSLDEALEKMRRLDVESLGWGGFESEVLADVKKFL